MSLRRRCLQGCKAHPVEQEGGTMTTRVRRCIASVFTGAVLLGASAAPAMAQVQNGLVNVAIGDVTILEEVNVGVAAQVAANICGVKVGPVAVLGNAVD